VTTYGAFFESLGDASVVFGTLHRWQFQDDANVCCESLAPCGVSVTPKWLYGKNSGSNLLLLIPRHQRKDLP
jgi:hypothetical protein